MTRHGDLHKGSGSGTIICSFASHRDCCQLTGQGHGQTMLTVALGQSRRSRIVPNHDEKRGMLMSAAYM
jgi:hypothetical protein